MNSQIPINDMTFNKLEKACGEENMGGMTTKGWLALDCHIAEWPSLKSNITEVADLCKQVGNFVMVNGKYFIPIKAIIRTPHMSAENQGEPEGKSFVPKIDFIVGGASKAQNMGYMRLLNNANGVLLWLDNDGNRVQVGSETHPAIFTPSGDSGANPSDRSEARFSAQTDDFCPGRLYYGSIPLSEGQAVDPIS